MCPIKQADGTKCSYKNKDGHFTRHIQTHLPAEVGFFMLCPACGEPSQRGDNFGRHAKKCAPKVEVQVPQAVLEADAQKNIFLHLPRTPELEARATAELANRNRNPSWKRNGFWLPSDAASYIEAKQRPGPKSEVPQIPQGQKRKRGDGPVSQPPPKKRKGGQR